MEFGFGPGTIYAVPPGTNATPRRVGALQDFSLDIAATVKELFGQYQFPLLVQRGTMKVTGKAKAAQISASAFNDIFFGQSITTGQVNTAVDEAQSVPATTTYTVQAAQHTTFMEDLGVTYATTGLPLTKVAAVTAIGQYAVDTTTGIYTFYSGDASAKVKLNYTYNTAASGTTLAVSNQLLGTTPVFQLVFTQTTDGKQHTITFPKCTSNKLTMATKLEDFTIPEMDLSFFADDSGNIFTISTSQP